MARLAARQVKPKPISTHRSDFTAGWPTTLTARLKPPTGQIYRPAGDLPLIFYLAYKNLIHPRGRTLGRT